jgi:hypothetical protein
MTATIRHTAWLATVLIAVGLLTALFVSLVPSASAESLAASPGAEIASGPASTSTLQAQVDSSAAGATVHLPAGTFVGQLRIDKNVKLVGAGVGKTILQSPATMSVDSLGNVFVVEVGQHATVSITRLTVRVTEQCMLANSIGVATGGGVGVRQNASLQIWNVRVVAYGAAPELNQPCTTHGSPGMLSFGRAISIGLDDPPGVGSNYQVRGHGSITHVATSGFDIFSISVGGVRGPTGSTATIESNVVGVGPGPYTAAYGIVAYGVSTISQNLVTGEAGSDGGIAVVFTSAVVTNNVVLNFTCTTAPFPITPPCGVDPLYGDQDLGIFLASVTPGTVVNWNVIRSVDSGILVEGPGAPAVISHNVITGSTFYAFELINAVQTFRGNVVVGGLYAVAVGAASANTTAILVHVSVKGVTVSLALLEANYPWVAKVVVRPK